MLYTIRATILFTVHSSIVTLQGYSYIYQRITELMNVIPAKAEICQARFSECFCCGETATEVRIERFSNLSAAKTRAMPYDAYAWQIIALCSIASLNLNQ